MGLLELPQELRDIIFHDLIIKETNTITMLPDFQNSPPSSSDISASPPSICNVNRQIRQETIPMFYAANRFSAQLDNEVDLAVARNWLAAIGEQNARHLRQISMCGWIRSKCQRRSYQWLKVVFHLKKGTMELGEGCVPVMCTHGKVASLAMIVEEVRNAYQELITMQAGRPFDPLSIQQLMERFSSICHTHNDTRLHPYRRPEP